MKILQAFKFQIQPDGAQQRYLRRIEGSCRYVWNRALAQQIENHDAGGKFISQFDMNNWLPSWKKDPQTCWLKETPSQILQDVMKNLSRAYKNFFKGRAQFPRFKKKGHSLGLCFPQGFSVEENHNRFRLPKLGWIKYRNSQAIKGVIKNVTISCVAGKWYASFLTQREVEEPKPEAITSIGIDVGIARFATMSDSSYIEPLNSFKKHAKKLARHQKSLSRKVKFSSNWKKEKARIQKIHHSISNARKDFLHKTTTRISKNHALVCMEDLQIGNMSKSSKGTLENPGKMVKQKSSLNRCILDQGWGEFRRQLEYKMSWNGGIFLAVPPHNTSRTCPCCQHISKENRRTQESFVCVSCGYENNADVVGAINVLERGHRLLACGEMVSLNLSVKQEPTEVTQASAA